MPARWRETKLGHAAAGFETQVGIEFEGAIGKNGEASFISRLAANQPLDFHDATDLYQLSGASTVATLYFQRRISATRRGKDMSESDL
jgi:hypothetical protein